MSINSSKQISDSKQLTILEAAAEEFSRYSWSESSYNRIIKNAGFSKGAVYHHFGSKLALYQHLLTEILYSLRPPLFIDGVIKTNVDFWRAFEENVAWLISWADAHPDQWHLVFKGILDYCRCKEGCGEQKIVALVQVSQWSEDFLASGQVLGCVRKDLSPECLFQMLCYQWDAIQCCILQDTMGQRQNLLMDTCRRTLSP